MDASAKQGGKRLVNEPVALQGGLSPEALRDNSKAEVAPTSVHVVPMEVGEIFDLHGLRV